MSAGAPVKPTDEPLTTRVPVAHAERLRELARQHDRTVAAEIRIAVRQYLERMEES